MKICQIKPSKKIEIFSRKELDMTIKRLANQVLVKVPCISSFSFIEIPTRDVCLSKLLAKYLEEISGQKLEIVAQIPFYIGMIWQGLML